MATLLEIFVMYKACPQNKVSNFFSHRKHVYWQWMLHWWKGWTFSYFSTITVAVDAILHALWHFSYTLVIEPSRCIANRTLTDFTDPFTQLTNCHMPIFKHFLFLFHFCSCFGRNRRSTRMLFIINFCMSVYELSDPLSHVFDVHALWPIDLHKWLWMSMGVVPLALKKQITARISHLMGEARGSSIANGCPVKTERRSRLGFVGIWRGGTKLYASIAGSSVKAFPHGSSAFETLFYGHAT